MVCWAIKLFEFDVQYEPRGPIKGEVYVDFVAEQSSEATQPDGSDFKPTREWCWGHPGRTKWIVDQAGLEVFLQSQQQLG